MEPTAIGATDGAPGPFGIQEPAITSTPDGAPAQSEPVTQSSAPVESTDGAPPETPETPETAPHPGEAYAAWLATQPPEVVKAEHARLAKVPVYDQTFNQDRSRRDAAERTKIEESVRLENEHRQVMEKNVQWLSTLVRDNPAAAAQAAVNDDAARAISNGVLDAAGFRQAQAEIVSWQSNQRETPTRIKIANEVADQTLAGLKADLAADPDWEGVAGKLDDLAKGEEVGPAAVATFIKRLAEAKAEQFRAEIRKEEQTKAEAKYSNAMADVVHGAPSHELAHAGVGGNGFASLDEAVAAHLRGDITNDQMRAYNRRFGRTN